MRIRLGQQDNHINMRKSQVHDFLSNNKTQDDYRLSQI